MRRLAPTLLAVLALAAPAAAAAAAPQTTLNDVEDEVMCTVCGVPLNLATDAPQAIRERAFIRARVAAGDSKDEIKRKLSDEFGPAVLAMPEAKGFNLTAYLVPAAVVLALLAALVALVPRWRRRSRDDAQSEAGPELSAADAARLDADLARYDT
jgi:cytochrome c-type biogenesis protein CcmH